MIIRATNDTNLLNGGWRLKILSDFLWKCFTAKLERFLLVRLQDKLAIFYSAENADAYESGHVVAISGKKIEIYSPINNYDFWKEHEMAVLTVPISLTLSSYTRFYELRNASGL